MYSDQRRPTGERFLWGILRLLMGWVFSGRSSTSCSGWVSRPTPVAVGSTAPGHHGSGSQCVRS